MRSRRSFALFSRLFLWLAEWSIWLMTVMAWARAGGGGGFGGGGGGGSGGGGGGDGIGILIYLLIKLCIHYPVIGIPLTILIIAAIFYGGKQSHEGYMSHVIHREAARQRDHIKQMALFDLSAKDAAFDEAQFLERVSQAFVKIQEAWSRQEMTPARAFISDGINERFSLQIDMQKAEGYRNVMENVTVLKSEIAAIYSDKHFDTIHVSIKAKAVDYDQSLKTNRRIRGDGNLEVFTEVWSFHRRHGAQTLKRNGSMEGNCPNCGAPLKIQDRAECTSCGSVVNSGEHDWVLAEITQVSEWSLPDPTDHVNGLEELRQSDPAMSVQHLEDRVSVMFYRINAAHFFQETGYVEPILASQLTGIPRMAALAENQFWKGPAIGKVETISIQSSPDGRNDEARVVVRWSGKLCEGDPTGRHRTIKPQAVYSHVYVLSRRKGVLSNPQRTFSSSSCPNCGAPIEVTKAESCAFCGTALTDGKHDWVLIDIERFSHQDAFRKMETSVDDLFTAPHNETYLDPSMMLAVLARVAVSDGHVDKKERKALRKLTGQSRLTDADLDKILQTAHRSDADLPVPETPKEARECLRQMIHVCLTDGRFTKQEQKLVADFASELDYCAADVKLMIAAEKRALYQEARRLQRERKKQSRNIAG
ncbi:MAG: TIM44-like domain-containing protein [Planctomycetaceae bacterium]|nr:TIM44-like domain-containing protein [Planctomycetaceae bacterium]